MTYSKDVPGFVANGLLMPFINEVRYSISRGSHAYERFAAYAGYHDVGKGQLSICYSLRVSWAENALRELQHGTTSTRPSSWA